MALLLILVFSGIFIVLVLLLFASGADVSKETKQTMTNLESVLAASPAASRDTVVNLRKDEIAERNSVDQSLAAEDRTGALSARECSIRPI